MAIAAAFAIAVVMYRIDRPTPATETAGTEAPEPEMRLTTSAEASAVKNLALNERPRVEGADRTPEGPAPSEREVDGRVEGFESIAPEPLAIARIEVTALEGPDVLAIEALSVAPIEVPALEVLSQD